jgi:hypothetical protein
VTFAESARPCADCNDILRQKQLNWQSELPSGLIYESIALTRVAQRGAIASPGSACGRSAEAALVNHLVN